MSALGLQVCIKYKAVGGTSLLALLVLLLQAVWQNPARAPVCLGKVQCKRRLFTEFEQVASTRLATHAVELQPFFQPSTGVQHSSSTLDSDHHSHFWAVPSQPLTGSVPATCMSHNGLAPEQGCSVSSHCRHRYTTLPTSWSHAVACSHCSNYPLWCT